MNKKFVYQVGNNKKVLNFICLQCNTELWTVICTAHFIPTCRRSSATAATPRPRSKLCSKWAALVVRVVLQSSEDLSEGDGWCGHYPAVVNIYIYIYKVIALIRMFVICVELTVLMLDWICFVWLWQWKLYFMYVLEFRTGRTFHTPM